MVKSLQAGFGEPLGAPLMTELYSRGVRGVRLDMQGVTDASTLCALTDEALNAGLRPLLIINAMQPEWIPSRVPLDIEFINEPDLAGWSASRYATALCLVERRLDGKHRLWAGGVSNCTKNKLRWLADVVRQIPLGIGVSVHRYPKNGAKPIDPQEGFTTRAEEMRAIRAVAGARPWGCSETGYHTGPQKSGWWLWTKRWQWTDNQVAAFARQEWALWESAGAEFCIWYQLNDGVSGDPIDHFGIRRLDGTWKPVSETFKENV